MIKYCRLEGYHVRANKTLDAALGKLYDRNGAIVIPWYMLLDNSGNILIRHGSAPSQMDRLGKEIRGE